MATSVAQTTGDNIALFKKPSMGWKENFRKIFKNLWFELEIRSEEGGVGEIIN